MNARVFPAITAVISTHNRCGELKTTLSGLIELGYPDLRIIVVDNASTDDTTRWIQENQPLVTVIPHSDTAPLAGYNLGFLAADTPYVMVMDDDSCPRKGCLERMVSILESDPDAGAIAANIIGRDGTSEWGSSGEITVSQDWYNLIGCGFLIRRDVLLMTQGYNESFGLYYNDLELGIRILAMGHSVLYDQACLVNQRQAGTRQGSARKLRLMLRNFPAIVTSHFSGLRKLDLIAGHTVVALAQCMRQGCLLSGLQGLVEGIKSPPQPRSFRQAGTMPGIRHFIADYSFIHTLKRWLTRSR